MNLRGTLLLLILTLIIGSSTNWMIAPSFHKYDIKEHLSLPNSEKTRRYLYDLDQDGAPELVYKNDHKGLPAINILNLANEHLAQHTFYGDAIDNELIFGDRDKNGIHEMYVPYVSGDSLLVGWVEGIKAIEVSKPIFITRINIDHGDPDISSHHGFLMDLNKDGSEELIFSAWAGFTLTPRRVYAYDFKNDTVYTSPYFGPQQPYLISNTDENGNAVILTSNSRTNNYPDSAKYGDRDSWIVMYDNQLNFLFPPKKLVSFKNWGNIPFLLKDKSKVNIIYTLMHQNTAEADSAIHWVNLKGDIVKSIAFPKPSGAVKQVLQNSDSTLAIISTEGEVYEVNARLELSLLATIQAEMNNVWYVDFDNDHHLELATLDKFLTTFSIYNDDYAHPTSYQFHQPTQIRSKYNVFHTGGIHYFLAFNNNLDHVLTYRKNPNYWYRYPLFLSVYLLVFGLLWSGQKIYALVLANRQKQLLELQLKNFRAQFNTHFTFNILNTIGSAIYEEEKDKAYDLFAKFSKMLRLSLVSSEDVAITLSQELEYVRQYLALQQYRFKDQLKADVTIDPEVNLKQIVPKLLIQSYVENAFKHAFNGDHEVNHLSITIQPSGSHTEIQIQDNGPGLEATSSAQGTRKGIKLMNEYYRLFYSLKGINIKQRYETTKDENLKPTGTLITLTIMSHDPMHNRR